MYTIALSIPFTASFCFYVLLCYSSIWNVALASSTIDPRIVGGKPVNGNDKYPFMAILYELIGNNKQFRCGGTLIGSNVVLSAAHCFDYIDYVEIGRYDQQDSNEEGMRGFFVIEKVKHPLFEGDATASGDHDVMVIRIDGDASNFAKVSLDTNENGVTLDPGTDLIVMGWGKTDDGGSTSSVLLEVEVDYVEHSVCSDNYESIEIITENMICAAREGGDSCQGDSGGPLITADGTNVQVGIVSFGEGCADINYPGVYASVAVHYEWIKSFVDLWEELISPEPTLTPSISLLPTSIENRNLFQVTLDGELTWHGNMFDIVSLRTEIAIHNFHLHMLNDNDFESIVIYTKEDSHVGFERDESKWIKICETNVEPRGQLLYTALPRNAISGPVIVGPSAIQAFYISMTKSASTSLLYSSGTAIGNIYAQNMDVAYLEGTSNGYPLFSLFFQPRIWNGAIIYTYQPIPSLTPSFPPTSQPTEEGKHSESPTTRKNYSPTFQPTKIQPTMRIVSTSPSLASNKFTNVPSIQLTTTQTSSITNYLPSKVPSITTNAIPTKTPTEVMSFPPTIPLVTGAPIGISITSQSTDKSEVHYMYILFASFTLYFIGERFC